MCPHPARHVGLLLAAAACASQPDRDTARGELLLPFDSGVRVGRVEFRREGTWRSFVVGPLAVGTTIYRLDLPAGRYCLVGYALDHGNWGGTYDASRPGCFDVPASTRTYAGHFTFDPSGELDVVFDPQRLDQQLDAGSPPLMRPRL